jgi:leader peptidase (prepilin peptidase)/N-methyltransferase
MFVSDLDLVLLAATGVLAVVLLWASVIDMRSFRLPDVLTLPLIPLGLLVSFYRVQDWPLDQAIAAVLGFGVFAALGALNFRARGVDGLGLGDAKLLGAAGAWLGVGLLPAVVLAAALAATFVLARGDKNRPIAFGPYLSAAFFCAWLWLIAGPRA